MKKFIKNSLLMIMAISLLSLTVTACNSRTGSKAEVPPTGQTTTTDSQQPEEQPSDKRPEQTPSEEQPSNPEKPSEDDKPTEEQPSTGGATLPGGLVDMGNFESKH